MKLAATNIRELKPSDIRIDGGTQVRVRLDEATVSEYRGLMEAYVEFPPLVIFFDGSTYWLADGFHRYHAFRKTGREKIACEVRPGDRRDAILYAMSANTKHGLPRSNEDRRNAVRILLSDEEWCGKSERWMAETASVSNHLVKSVREAIAPKATGNYPSCEARLGKDGKVRRVPEPKSQQRKATAGSHPTCSDKPIPPPVKKAEPNIIGGLKSRLESFLGELVEGQPAHVCMAIADHLELLAQDLRK